MDTKRCPDCEKEVARADFLRNLAKPDGFGTYCKECWKVRLAKYYAKNTQAYVEKARRHNAKMKPILRQLVDEFRSSGCRVCGEKTACCLAAHHREPGGKDFAISNAVSSGRSTNRFSQELAKCVCLCHNCHSKVHAGILTIPNTLV